jgi:hypothetical protein
LEDAGGFEGAELSACTRREDFLKMTVGSRFARLNVGGSEENWKKFKSNIGRKGLFL